MIFYSAKSNRQCMCDKAVLVNKSTDNNIIYTFEQKQPWHKMFKDLQKWLLQANSLKASEGIPALCNWTPADVQPPEYLSISFSHADMRYITQIHM